MIKEKTDVVLAAKEYVEKGYTIIPVNKKQPARFIKEKQEDGSIKKVSRGWEKSCIILSEVETIFTHEYLELPESVPINIGIVSSENNLLDIDLDCAESRLLAKFYLPDTDCVFGRDTSRDSHWLYQCSKSEYTKFSYLVDPQNRKSDVTILEIRPLNGKKFQTVVPPSIHYPSNERISYSPEKNGDPTKIDFETIHAACNRLAVASLISTCLDSGIRQDLVIALAGTLAKLSWSRDEIIQFIDPILRIFDDPNDYRTRLQGIEKTISKHESGSPVTGIAKLKELVQDHIYQKLRVWLGITRTEFPIFETNNSLFFRRETSKGCTIERLTSFTMKPIKSVHVPEEGIYLHCNLITESGREMEITFPPDSFDSSGKFKRALSKFGNEHTVFLGNDVQLQLLKEFISMLNKDEVIGSSISGFNSIKIANEERMFFITEDGSLTLNKDSNNIELSQSVSFISDLSSDCKLVTVSSPFQDEIDLIKPYIDKFNSPEIVQAVLGWTVATFFRRYFFLDRNLDGFPVLFISGGSGSGKSKTAQNIIHNIWGIESKLKSFIEQSNFTVVKYMGSSNNIPIVFDEAKTNRMSKFKKDVFSNLIRTSYDNSVANKGRQDQTMVNYKYSRPLALCSETGLNESAHLDRTIFVTFSLLKSRAHSKEFTKLSSMDLSIVGRAIIDYILTSGDQHIQNTLKSCNDKIPDLFEDRPRVCLTAISFGLKVLSEILEMNIEPLELFEKQGEHFYMDTQNKGIRISEVDKTLVSWCLMSKFAGESALAGSYLHDTYLEENEHYKVKDGCIFLHIPSIFPLFRKWDRTYEHQGDLLDQKTFLQQVREEPYFVEKDKNMRMGSKQQRCLVLDLKKIDEKGVELFHPWINEEDEKAK